MTQRDSVARSAVYTLAMRWSDRLIGLVSMVILARLLAPADFGIIAMAMLVIGLVDVFLDLGVNIALIQRASLTQAHYDAAWTLRLGQTTLATLVVVLAAPLAALYFNDPRIAPVLRVMGFSLLITGLENIGVIQFQKEMRFGQDFRFEFTKRIVGFVATITAAWLMRSYWALVVGTLAGRGFGVLLSYWIHPMRPRLSMHSARDIFSVSQWTLVRGVGEFLDQNLHKWIVGGRVPATLMGSYSVADDVSFLPSSALLIPLNRVLFPAFVLAKENLKELKRIFLLAQGLQALVGIPASVGLILVAGDVVHVLLGDKWVIAIPFIQVLAVVRIIAAITSSGGYLLTALGKFRALAAFAWTRVSLFAFAAYLLFPQADAMGIAILRAAFVVIALALFAFWVRHALPALRMSEMVVSVSRPLAAAGIMSGVVFLPARFVLLPFAAALVVKVVVGALTYIAVVALLWRVRGRPTGPETYLLDKLRQFRS
jgi:O-antigen/teichoic acid export membrane protein